MATDLHTPAAIAAPPHRHRMRLPAGRVVRDHLGEWSPRRGGVVIVDEPTAVRLAVTRLAHYVDQEGRPLAHDPHTGLPLP